MQLAVAVNGLLTATSRFCQTKEKRTRPTQSESTSGHLKKARCFCLTSLGRCWYTFSRLASRFDFLRFVSSSTSNVFSKFEVQPPVEGCRFARSMLLMYIFIGILTCISPGLCSGRLYTTSLRHARREASDLDLSLSFSIFSFYFFLLEV